jgi:hypothetical protein
MTGCVAGMILLNLPFMLCAHLCLFVRACITPETMEISVFH